MDTDDSKEIREELNLYAGIEKTLFSMGLCNNDTTEESEDSQDSEDSENSETGFRGFLEDPIPSTSGNSKGGLISEGILTLVSLPTKSVKLPEKKI